MTKQEMPYLSAAASGSIRPGIATRNTAGTPHLIRIATKFRPRTEAQKTHQRFLHALAEAWTTYKDLARDTWISYAQSLRMEPYHAYIHVNFRRLAQDLYPTLLYPPDDTKPTNRTWPYDLEPHRLATSALTVLVDLPFVAFSAWAIGLTDPGEFTPKTATHWYMDFPLAGRRILHPLPTRGLYYHRNVAINRYGSAAGVRAAVLCEATD
jgi:hypothetical protein